MVTHSYDNYCYDSIARRMVYMKPKYTFLYNPDIMEWDSIITNPPAITTDYHNISVNFTRHGSVAWVQRGTGSTYDLYLFSPDSLRWRLLPRTGAALASSYGDNAGACYDSKRDRLVMVQGLGTTNPDLRVYDFATGACTQVTPSNNSSITGTDMYRECLYLSDLDMVMTSAQVGGANLFYDCANNVWVLATLPKGAGVGTVSSRSSGYMLDTKRNLIWDSETNCETYVLKLTSALFAGIEDAATSVALTSLLRVTPNPFAVLTRIQTRPGGGADILVHDLSGRIVSRLRSDVRTGIAVWNAGGLPGGVYLVSVRQGGKLLNRKMTLLK
jgi:hypothetical protein